MCLQRTSWRSAVDSWRNTTSTLEPVALRATDEPRSLCSVEGPHAPTPGGRAVAVLEESRGSRSDPGLPRVPPPGIPGAGLRVDRPQGTQGVPEDHGGLVRP